MADVDLMPARGVPFRARVDANGIAFGGSATVAELAQRGMQPVCIVDSNGLNGAVTVEQLAQRGIRAACLVDANGLAGGVNADELARRGIRALVQLTAAGLSGAVTMLELAQRGLGYACLVDQSGASTGASGNLRFGVNMSGPEFSPWNGQTFPSNANWTYLAGLGVTFVRLPVAWESLQTTLNGALDATYLGKIQTAIAGAKAVGISTIVELHNFGFYASQAKWTTTVGYAGNAGTPATGVNVLGDGTLTAAHLADVWTKLATALPGSTPGLVGFGIMNEPAPGIVSKNILTTPNYFTGATWFTQNGSVQTIQGAGTNPLGAAYGPAWNLSSGTGFGGVAMGRTVTAVPYVLSIYAKTASGTEPLVLTFDGTNSGTLTATTTWQRFQYTKTPAAGTPLVVFTVNATTGHNILIANAQLEFGSAMTAYEPSVWQPYAQAAVSAIRAVNATIPIYVCGNNFGTAAKWHQDNYELALLTGGNLIHEAHQYFDGPQGVGGGGSYSGTFTSYGCDTNTGAQAIAPFTGWLAAQGATGFLGEFGVPNSVADNNAQWLPTQVNFLNALKTANVNGAQWFFGSNGVQPANILNIATLVNDPRLIQMLGVGVPPANTVAPVISGTVTVGSTLTSTTGTWTGNPAITYAYQWKRDGAAVGGATASTYVLVSGDLAAMMTCTVTVTSPDGSASATSNALGPVVVGVSTEAQQFFSRVADPGPARKSAYSTLIDGLVADGVWSKIDVLCMLAAADAATALTNIKSASFNPTATAAPAFVADRGYTFNGTSNYLETGFNSATAGGQYALNSAHVGAYLRTLTNDPTVLTPIGTFDGANFSQVSISNSSPVVLLNDANTASGLSAVTTGMVIATRTASNARKAYGNGAQVTLDTATGASIALPNRTFFVGARNQGGPVQGITWQVAAYSIGSGLNDAQAAALSTRINAYMTAVGANVY